MKKTIAIYTLGCRANQFDSETILADFIDNGYQRVKEFSNAHIHIVNTCTVTNTGDKKSQQVIKKIVQKFPQSQVIATGCSAQQNPQILANLGVDLVVDNTNKNNILQYLHQKIASRIVHSPIRKVTTMEQKTISHFGNKTRAHLKIQDGCNQYCSYCIIPHVRGRSRSLPPEKIQIQLKQLLKAGYREIVLTGIHVGHYQHSNLSFADVLAQILQEPQDFRIRLSSIEPLEINDKILSLFQRYPDKLCRFLHIAIQSGSSSILHRMKRRYDIKYLQNLFQKVHQIDSSFGLGIDVIVGFPNETEQEFLETVQFLKTIPLYYGHVFPFSPKKGTPAALFPHQISTTEKKSRSLEIRLTIQEQQQKFLSQLVNQEHIALFEQNNIGILNNFVRIKIPESMKQHQQAKIKIKSSWEQSETEKYPIIHSSLMKILN